MQSFFGCWSGREETVVLEVATPLEATVTVDEESAAKQEAQHADRRLTNFTDGSRLAVTWMKGNTWEGYKTHMGWGQEAYDANRKGLTGSGIQRPYTRNSHHL